MYSAPRLIRFGAALQLTLGGNGPGTVVDSLQI
jgi:hypothetical protein